MHRKPLVVVCTDGHTEHHTSKGITAELRRNETLAAMSLLDCETEFLGIKDTEVSKWKLKCALEKYKPTKVYAPKPNSSNEQHNMVGYVAYELWPKETIYYSTYTEESLTPKGEIKVLPVDMHEVNLKIDAMNCYDSQIGINYPHFHAVNRQPEYLNFPDEPVKVSAVLVGWKRHDELMKIEDLLLRVPFINEVLVHRNTDEDNMMVYGRYFKAKWEATNDIIYVQDDDCLVEGIGELYTAFDGIHLTNNMDDPVTDYTVDTLVGWGAFFKREWIDVFDKWKDKDDFFNYNADRIFTTLLNKPHNTMRVKMDKLPAASDGNAMYHNPQHSEWRAQAVARAKELLDD
jgi:hypothetical protein